MAMMDAISVQKRVLRKGNQMSQKDMSVEEV